ncbi:MAG: hypothetical protein HY647_11045 [Acidobacteria bacterium]|nr:hypothetical protein [Acidobacteriota bacterium]
MITVKEFSSLHDIYRTMVEKELGYSFPLPQGIDETLAQKDSDAASEAVGEPLRQWLALLDSAINPHQLRSYVIGQKVEEPVLESLIRFLVAKPSHSQADRDKVDWLATYLFKLQEERSGLPAGWPKAAVLEILRGFEFPPLTRHAEDLLNEIPPLLDEINYVGTFSQITDSHVIQRGRDLKDQFGEAFFQPDVLAAIVNYNLLFGKKFNELFQETTRKVHEFAQTQSEAEPLDAQQLLQSDYRSTTDAFQQLSELGRREGLHSSTPSLMAEGDLERQLKHLGIDSTQEALYLRNRIEELTIRLQANPGLTSIPNPFAPLLLHDWEASAFRTLYAKSEQTYRADFARSVRHAIAIISRIFEEIPLYQEKTGTEYLWKKHYDALVYLLYEGRAHKESLLRLAVLSEQRGLQEKSKQLQLTVQKLDASLAKVAALF